MTTFFPNFTESNKDAIAGFNKAFDLAYSSSLKFLQHNVSATKQIVERQATYADTLKGVRRAEELAKLQDTAVKGETAAAEDYARNIYSLASETASEVVNAAEAGWKATDKLVVDSVNSAVDALPVDRRLPVLACLRESVLNQLSAYKNLTGVVVEAVKNSRESFASLVTTAETTLVPAKPVAASKQRRAN